jgi:bifunctional non-homologous end joining protein LigD
MSLATYHEKRNFKKTAEPEGKEGKSGQKLLYVVQKHRATALHYDFRLEHNGVLLSWAVPKGPSLDPSVKRLAMQVEDHPVDYGGFEGIIPEGEYGGGTVMLWDTGEWTPENGDPGAAMAKGDFKFTLMGEKLKGSWVLVKTRGFGSKTHTSWLLIKHRDQFASTEEIAETEPRSVKTNRLMAEIARDEGGDVERAATGDPQEKTAKKPAAGKSAGTSTGKKAAAKPSGAKRTAAKAKK